MEAAHQECYGQLLIPAIQVGVITGAIKKNLGETIVRLKQGIERFMQEYGKQIQLKNVTFVGYRDSNTAGQLTTGLGRVST